MLSFPVWNNPKPKRSKLTWQQISPHYTVQMTIEKEEERLIFTQLATRPIQSSSRNVRISVPSRLIVGYAQVIVVIVFYHKIDCIYLL